MQGEVRDLIKIIIDPGIGAEYRAIEGTNLKYIRVLPACKYSDMGSRVLTPVELNEAVQMWMNHKERVEESQKHVTFTFD